MKTRLLCSMVLCLTASMTMAHVIGTSETEGQIQQDNQNLTDSKEGELQSPDNSLKGVEKTNKLVLINATKHRVEIEPHGDTPVTLNPGEMIAWKDGVRYDHNGFLETNKIKLYLTITTCGDGGGGLGVCKDTIYPHIDPRDGTVLILENLYNLNPDKYTMTTKYTRIISD